MDLGDVINLISQLPALANVIGKFFFLTICFFLGSFAWKGWKKYHNWGLSTIMIIILSFIILSGSILIYQLIPFQLPYIPYAIQALIISIILYVILRLLSGDAEALGKFVRARSFKKIKLELQELKEDYHRLIKLLERKGLAPKPLTIKELKDNLIEELKKQKIKGEIIKEKLKEKVSFFEIKGKDYYKAVLDNYTGELVSLEKINLTFKEKLTKLWRLLTNNDRVFAGVIISIMFSLFLLLLLTPSAINEINSYFTLSQQGQNNEFTNYKITNNSCLSAQDITYVLENEKFDNLIENSTSSFDFSKIYSNYRIFESLKLTYDNDDYFFETLTSLSNNDFWIDVDDYLKNNLFSVIQGNIDFCDIKHNGKSFGNYFMVCSIKGNKLCECAELKHIQGGCDYFSRRLLNKISSSLLSR